MDPQKDGYYKLFLNRRLVDVPLKTTTKSIAKLRLSKKS